MKLTLQQEIDRVLTEYNFDRMDFDEAKQKLLDLHSVETIETLYDKWQLIEGEDVDDNEPYLFTKKDLMDFAKFCVFRTPEGINSISILKIK